MVDYEGILSGYPFVRRRFGRLAGFLQLVRPFTLLAPLVAGLLGVLSPLESVGLDDLMMGVYAGVTLALAQASGQCLNQYADADLDSKAKPYRPIPSRLISREEALGLSWLLAIISIGRAFTLTALFGVIVLILLFFAVFYSLAPFSPRRISPILNILWLATSRGFLPMVAVMSMYGLIQASLPYALIAFLWVLAFQPSKDLPDMSWDRAYGIKTIPNVYGPEGLRAWMGGMTIMFAAACLILRPIFLLLTPLAIVAIATMRVKAKVTENTISWACFYSGLALIYVILFFLC